MANALIFFAKKVTSFCIAKATHFFVAKGQMHENTLAITVNKFFINELVTVTML